MRRGTKRSLALLLCLALLGTLLPALPAQAEEIDQEDGLFKFEKRMK